MPSIELTTPLYHAVKGEGANPLPQHTLFTH